VLFDIANPQLPIAVSTRLVLIFGTAAVAYSSSARARLNCVLSSTGRASPDKAEAARDKDTVAIAIPAEALDEIRPLQNLSQLIAGLLTWPHNPTRPGSRDGTTSNYLCHPARPAIRCEIYGQ
jgi:hypothetical protein